jgi:hypothetical protein
LPSAEPLNTCREGRVSRSKVGEEGDGVEEEDHITPHRERERERERHTKR